MSQKHLKNNFTSTQNLDHGEVLSTASQSPPASHNCIDTQRHCNKKAILKQYQYHKSTLYVYAYGLTIALGALFTGYNFSVLSLAQPKLNLVYEITENKELLEGIFSSCLLLGAFGGSLLSGSLISKIGERKTCLFSDLLASIVLLFYCIPNFYVATSVRFLLGIVIGINDTSVLQFVKSISPKELSGTTGTFFTSMGAVGMFFGYLSGLGFPLDEEELANEGDFYWRVVLVLPIVFLVLNALLLTFVFKYDTPQYIHAKEQNPEKVKQALACIYKPENIEEQYEIIKKICEAEAKDCSTWKQEFQGSSLHKLKLVLNLQLMYIFSGLMPIIMFCNIIFQKSTGSKTIALYMSIGLGFIQIITCFFAGELSKFYGRVSIIKVGTFIAITILTGFGAITQLTAEQVENDDVPLLSSFLIISILVLFVMSFRMSSGSVVWTYMAEISTAKRSAMGLAFFYFINFVLGSVFPFLQNLVGISYIFYMFAGVQLFLILFLYSKLKETKGLTQVQINKLFDVEKKEQKEKIEKKDQNVDDNHNNKNNEIVVLHTGVGAGIDTEPQC